MRALALPLAMIALALSGSAVFLGFSNYRTAPPPIVVAPQPAAPVVDDTAEKLVEANRRIAALEARVAALAEVATARPAQPAERDEPVAEEADSPVNSKQYVRFTPPAPMDLEVEQTEGGALVVTNRDARLTDQVVVLQGEREDGTQVPVTIVVPPPEG